MFSCWLLQSKMTDQEIQSKFKTKNTHKLYAPVYRFTLSSRLYAIKHFLKMKTFFFSSHSEQKICSFFLNNTKKSDESILTSLNKLPFI